MMQLDIEQNRKARKYSRKELFKRAVWSVVRLAFICSPRIAFAYRNAILRLFGASIGKGVRIYASAHIYLPWNLSVEDEAAIGEHALIYNLGNVVIGARATISQGSHLCAGTHDYESVSFELIKASIQIEEDAWVCADAFVGPGVEIGRGAVVGARAVVTKSVASWDVVAGNPAKVVKRRELRDRAAL